MNLAKAVLTFLACAAITTQAQEPTSTNNPVSNSEIAKLAESVKLDQWVEFSRNENFSKKSIVVEDKKYGGRHTASPLQYYWEKLYGSNQAPGARLFRDGWNSELTEAAALLKRPCTNSQREWLVKFRFAGDALSSMDSSRFQEFVVKLSDDLKML